MTWNDPLNRDTGDLITAAIWNQDVVDNAQYLYENLGMKVQHSGVGTYDLTATSAWQTMDSLSIPEDTLTDGAGVFIFASANWYGTDNGGGGATSGTRLLLGATAFAQMTGIHYTHHRASLHRLTGLGGLTAQRAATLGLYYNQANTGAIYMDSNAVNNWVGHQDLAENNDSGALTLALQGYHTAYSGSGQGFKFSWLVMGYG
jgi:hypothetical protein